MVSLNALRTALALKPAPTDEPFHSVEEALALLPSASPAALRPAALRLLALEMMRGLPTALALIGGLQSALGSAKPERDLVQWLAQITGGQAELISSWGDLVSRAGSPSGPRQEGRLVYEGRHVGTLALEADPVWTPLFLVTAEFARLARLQAAAAGAARRRVGERVLEALLVGDTTGAPESEPCTLAALRFAELLPRSERSRDHYIQALDVLCGVGEGYFQARGLKCFTTVRGDKALWLWQSADPEREAAGLRTAVLAATDQDVRIGLSTRQDGYSQAGAALRQALQALAEARHPRTLVPFSRIDPLHALLGSEAMAALREQLRQRLADEDTDGKLEATLRRYLSHRGSAALLARQMNIHVNTLRYRLKRVEELLDGDLSEPSFVARMYLALNADEPAPPM